MNEKLKSKNPELYKFISGIFKMDFFVLCKESILEEEWDTLNVLFKGLMLIDDRYVPKDITGNIDEEDKTTYLNLLDEDFPLELQFKIYDTTNLLSDAFRDEVEAELLNKENLPMVIKAASVFGEYEDANGGDFFEFVCDFLEEEKELSMMVEEMSAYFGLEYADKCDDSYERILEHLKEENVKYLPERFFNK